MYKNVKGAIFIKIIQLYPVATGVRIVTTEHTYEVAHGMRYVLQALCMASGSSYQGRVESAKRWLNSERLVPLFVDANHVFIFTHSLRRFECIAYNVFALEGLETGSFLTTKKAKIAIQKALKVHQIFTGDYDIMKYLKGSTTDEEKNLT